MQQLTAVGEAATHQLAYQAKPQPQKERASHRDVSCCLYTVAAFDIACVCIIATLAEHEARTAAGAIAQLHIATAKRRSKKGCLPTSWTGNVDDYKLTRCFTSDLEASR